MLTAPEVPRLSDGRLKLCHDCQRQSVTHRGFMLFLRQRVVLETQIHRGRSTSNSTCPYCGSPDRTRMKRRSNSNIERWTCRACLRTYTDISNTEFRNTKLAPKLMKKMSEMFAAGATPNKVVLELGICHHTARRWYRVWQSRLNLADIPQRRGSQLFTHRQRRSDGTVVEYYYCRVTGKRLTTAEAEKRKEESNARADNPPRPRMTDTRRRYLECLRAGQLWSRGRGCPVEAQCERLGWTKRRKDGQASLTAAGVEALEEMEIAKAPDRGRCNVAGCERAAHARGLCNSHYWRMTRYGHTESPQPNYRRGSLNRGAKLTEDKVRAIRGLSGTVRQHEIAKRFGVSGGIISDIISRKRWKHVA